MKELQEKLNKLLAKIAAKSSLGDALTPEDVEALDKWEAEAESLQVRIRAGKMAEEHEANEKARIEKEKEEAVKAAQKEMEDKFKAEKNRIPFGEAPYQTKYNDERKYANMDAVDLGLMLEFAGALKANGQRINVSPIAKKALARKVSEMDFENNDEGRKQRDYVIGNFEAGTGVKADSDAIDKAWEGEGFKAATDPMYSTLASAGDDWVGAAFSSQIWASIRSEDKIVGKIPADVVPDGYESKTWPLESTDPTFYKVAEATAADATMGVPVPTVTASQMATSNKQITLGKMGARTMYTGELVEGSLIRFAPQLRTQMMAKGREVLAHVCIDGDVETSASKNINDIAGTPAGTEPFLLFDGFRKLALVTNTANSYDAGGAFAVEDYKQALQRLGTAGLAGADPSKVAFVQDFNTMWAAMEIPELKTKDISSAAAIEEGVLERVYRVPVVTSYQMHYVSAAASYERKANTAGKVDLDTDANNTTGSILAVRFDQWKVAYKRRMTIETTRIANADSWEIVALMRFGLAYRDNEASAITYNVGV